MVVFGDLLENEKYPYTLLVLSREIRNGGNIAYAFVELDLSYIKRVMIERLGL
jgi:hypothetical protein